MSRRFLVASNDEPVSHWAPAVVSADNKKEAIRRYLQIVYSQDPLFRESVLDLSATCSFVERFFITTPEESRHFERTGEVNYDLEVVKSRVKAYFAERPDLGEKFARYMDTRNASHVDEEVFEFIAAADPDGIVALDLEEICQL